MGVFLHLAPHLSCLICNWHVVDICLLPELGYGWRPAIIDSEEELNLIIEKQNNDGNFVEFFVGGSTASSSRVSFNRDYRTDNSGNPVFLIIVFGQIERN